MDYNLYNTIKVLKKLAGSGNTSYISSGELAKDLGVSQQTASRFIIELNEKKYIERTLQNRKQKITLLEPSRSILFFIEYINAFVSSRIMSIILQLRQLQYFF